MMENTAYLYAKEVIWAANVLYTTEKIKVFVSTIWYT
jgi:hypothetical protein